MDKSIKLTVGQTIQLKRFKDRIAYAGMPSENTYSIVQINSAKFENTAAWNLFYPQNTTKIIIDGVNIFIDRVTSDAISLRIGTWE